MPDYFPVLLDVRGRRALVVGGGPLAARKVRDLLECSASVTVISPALTPDLATLVTAGLVERVGRARDRARARAKTPAARLAAGERVVAEALAPQPVGLPSE